MTAVTRRLLCTFGIHRWEKWTAPESSMVTTHLHDLVSGRSRTWSRPALTQERTCLACGKFVWRKT